MSLEAAIAENTAAVKLLTEAIHAGHAAAAAKQTTAATTTAPAGGAALPPKQAAEAEQRKKPEPPAAEQQQQPVTYDNVKAAVNGLAKAKGRDAVIAALGEFGLKNATEAKPEQWPEIVKKFTDLAAVPA
jgi:hypothetical protein